MTTKLKEKRVVNSSDSGRRNVRKTNATAERGNQHRPDPKRRGRGRRNAVSESNASPTARSPLRQRVRRPREPLKRPQRKPTPIQHKQGATIVGRQSEPGLVPVKRSLGQARPRGNSFDWGMPVSTLVTWFALLIGVVSAVLHGLDLLFAWPFHRASMFYDSVIVICGSVLTLLSVQTILDRRKRGK